MENEASQIPTFVSHLDTTINVAKTLSIFNTNLRSKKSQSNQNKNIYFDSQPNSDKNFSKFYDQLSFEDLKILKNTKNINTELDYSSDKNKNIFLGKVILIKM